MKKLGVLAILLAACGDRPDVYDTTGTIGESFGLVDRVAIIDDSAHRVALLTPHADQKLDTSFVAIGKTAVHSEVSPDQKRLFVLTAGDVPRRKGKDQPAALSVIENGVARSLRLESPHTQLALDPQGRYVAIFAGPAQTGVPSAFVENPNEIVIVDLAKGDAEAVTPRTLRSFGGRPQRVTFTDTLSLPGGPRRLLVVETDQDVHLLDLDHVRDTPQRPEITVRLTSGSSADALVPAGVVVDEGDPAKNDDTRIGIRTTNSPSVFNLTLVPETNKAADAPGTVPNDFRPEVNLTDVGGIPGDIVFVHTEAGLRLAAIVPSTQKAVLFDPTTSITTDIDLPAAYSRISLITNVVAAGAGTDTALLYGSGSGVAFLSLGKAVGQTYRTVEVVSLASAIQTVDDIPPPRPELKVLEGQGASSFFVLNLASRTASPLTTQGQASIHVAPDGQRLWAFSRGTQNLAAVTLDNLHPIALPLDHPIQAVFDTARPEGGRALVAVSKDGRGGVTVLDALAPDTTTSRSYYGILLEGL